MIPVDCWGRIAEGREIGWYVKLVDDRPVSGGWLVLEVSSLDRTAGFDNWFERQADALEYLSGYVIEWGRPSHDDGTRREHSQEP